jgi:serine/threonine protein kinase
VYEYCERGSLLDWFKDRKKNGEQFISKYQLLKWATQMCSALSHMHQHKMTHNDLHIDNWVIRKNYDIVLTDFGCGSDMTKWYGESCP